MSYNQKGTMMLLTMNQLQESRDWQEDTETLSHAGWAATPPRSSAAADDSLRILLVEDVQSDAILLRLALEATQIPCTIDKIQRGDEALSHLHLSQVRGLSSLPDLMMLDLGLPGMDGFELLAELSQMPVQIRSLPIVILTAHQHFEYIRKSYPLYVMDYVNKPCHAAGLRELLLRARSEKDKRRHLN